VRRAKRRWEKQEKQAILKNGSKKGEEGPGHMLRKLKRTPTVKVKKRNVSHRQG